MTLSLALADDTLVKTSKASNFVDFHELTTLKKTLQGVECSSEERAEYNIENNVDLILDIR